MNKETQIQPIQLQITRDGEVTQEFQPEPPTLAENALNGLHSAIGHIRLETRMIVFDALHGTNYREIRHQLVLEKKRKAFEESIGIIAVEK